MNTALKNQIRRLTQKLQRLEKHSKRISTIRLFDVLLGLLVIYIAAQSGKSWLFWLIVVLTIVSFILLVSWHRKIDDAILRFSGWIKIRRYHLARMALDWNNIPDSAQQKNYESHPYARDLNVVGKRSLFQLMNTATYSGGAEYLKKWLLIENPDIAKLSKRQKLVKELKPMAHFRDRLHLYADIAKQKISLSDWSMDDLLLWIRSTQQSGFSVPLLILGSLAIVNITLLLLYILGFVDPYVIFSFVIYVLVYNFYSDKTSGLFDEAQQIEKLLSQFREVLLYLESFPYKKESKLARFCDIYHCSKNLPSNYLKRIIRIASAASSQSSDIIRLLLNMVVPWDLYFAKKLNAYKTDLEPKLTQWLDRFYRLEALNSIANFAWLNDNYIFAVPDKHNKTVLKAENLGHPLIPKEQKVTNNVEIDETGDIFLITGSNMAGKSTFLRTVGINLCLCFAGAPVNATVFQTILFRLFSSINVTDSLNEGLSHFYAEVKRLHMLLDELKKDHPSPLFYMVDEIYRGTNNRERLRGSSAFLKQVADKNGIGLVSTHDLELADLSKEIDSLSNWHFEETIENGKMSFEYKLKPGPCPTTNALKIMEMEGLPV